jgi:hypothetical protein
VTDDFVSSLRVIVDRLDELQIPYMLVGSVAALVHGRSRTTQDFDVVIDVDAARLRSLIAALSPDRFYVSEEAAIDALRNRSMFNIVDLESGWKVDIIVRKRRPFSMAEFERRTKLELSGMPVFVATIEDTIIAKLEWSKLAGGSARQLEDVRELVALASTRLDAAYIEQWVNDLGLTVEWRSIVATPGRSGGE